MSVSKDSSLGPHFAKKIVEWGYYQVSRKFRLVARLPKGMDGISALIQAERINGHISIDATIDAEKWARRLGNTNAADQYLRVYAQTYCLRPDTFEAFLKCGGGTYLAKHWDDPLLTDIELRERIEGIAVELEAILDYSKDVEPQVSAQRVAAALRKALNQGVAQCEADGTSSPSSKNSFPSLEATSRFLTENVGKRSPLKSPMPEVPQIWRPHGR